jgi:hypothetical protein
MRIALSRRHAAYVRRAGTVPVRLTLTARAGNAEPRRARASFVVRATNRRR